MESVTIVIVTFERPKEIRQTIQALKQHVKYEGDLRWHIADDASHSAYIPNIKSDFPELDFTSTITQRKGWGANVNYALDAAKPHSDFIFLCEDDYVATRDIDLTRGVELLEHREKIGLVRYDGLSAHSGLRLYLEELKIDQDRFDYFIVEKGSDHLNVYSHRPHLKHVRFHEAYGKYDESLSLGETESGFAHRVKDSNGPEIAILWNGIERAFDHIGKSRQGGEFDIR